MKSGNLLIESASTIEQWLNSYYRVREDSTQLLRDTFVWREIGDDETGDASQSAQRLGEIDTPQIRCTQIGPVQIRFSGVEYYLIPVSITVL